MALFTVTVNAVVNNPPNQIGNLGLTLSYNELYTFISSDFTTSTIPQYQDPEGDDYENIKIVTLPTVGTLTLNAVAVSPLDEISKADIDLGLLQYQADPADLDGYIDSDMTFDVSDDGSSLYSGLTPGIVTFTVGAQANQPPSAVGDNALVTNYGQTIVFTSANFTTETTPMYTDPEADAAASLKVISLPLEGTLKLNGVNVVINQIISFSDISGGLFTFVPNNANTSLYNIDFEYQIADAGSGIFVG